MTTQWNHKWNIIILMKEGFIVLTKCRYHTLYHLYDFTSLWGSLSLLPRDSCLCICVLDAYLIWTPSTLSFFFLMWTMSSLGSFYINTHWSPLSLIVHLQSIVDVFSLGLISAGHKRLIQLFPRFLPEAGSHSVAPLFCHFYRVSLSRLSYYLLNAVMDINRCIINP